MFHNINLLKSRTISSKLQIEGHTNLVITNIVPENISVTLVGNEEDIIDISGEDIITFVDISDFTEKGTYRVPVQIIKTGDVLKIDTLEISVEPVDIRIQLDNMSKRLVTITPAISGSLAAGYDLVSENVEPSQIQIEGPETSIAGIDTITTVPFDISDRYSDFSTRLELVIPGQLFTIHGHSSVEYSAAIRPAYVSKYFSDISLKAANLNESFAAEIVPKTGGITLHGKYNDIENFVPVDDLLTVDCSEIKNTGNFELPVTVNADGLFEAAGYIPETAVVKVNKREE
jgi:hypothetical protein